MSNTDPVPEGLEWKNLPIYHGFKVYMGNAEPAYGVKLASNRALDLQLQEDTWLMDDPDLIVFPIKIQVTES